MKRFLIYIACLGLVLTAIPVTKAQAAVSFSLRIGDRYRGPRLAFYSQPDVMVIPGTEVYYVENADYDLYRYGDYWYYFYDGGWYRADDLDGPFYFISYTSVPYSIRYVPVSYRHHWRDYRGAMYGSYRNGYWYGRSGYTNNYYQQNRTNYYPTRTYYQNRTYQNYDRNRTSYQSRPEAGQSTPTRNYIQQQNNHYRDYNQVNRREVPQQPQQRQQQAPTQGRGQGQGNGRGHGQGNGNGHGNGRGHNQDQGQ